MTDNIRNEGSDQQPVRRPGERDDPGAAPEAVGIPEHADDETPGAGQVPEPQHEPMPADRPVVSDDYGTTAAETRHGEPLSGKLAREDSEPALDQQRVWPSVHEETDIDQQTDADEVAAAESDR